MMHLGKGFGLPSGKPVLLSSLFESLKVNVAFLVEFLAERRPQFAATARIVLIYCSD